MEEVNLQRKTGKTCSPRSHVMELKEEKLKAYKQKRQVLCNRLTGW